jgi:hypothetical protein
MKKIIFETKEQYLDAVQAWKKSFNKKTIQFTAEHFALYAIMRDKDPRKCFATPEQQSERKLIAQDKTGNETYERCMRAIMSGYRDAHLLGPFQGKLTDLHLAKIREHWKKDAA